MKKIKTKLDEIIEDKNEEEKSENIELNKDERSNINVEDKIRYKSPSVTLPSILKYLEEKLKNA